LELFTDYEVLGRRQAEEAAALDKERRLMEATLSLKKRFGKNSILKGVNYEEGATQRERNQQIGGHKA
ncbi:MAG: DNA methylase, partial [Bacteroidales bacterium]|nr:DNA methylase [Bacteroidales bacterium]